MFVFVFFVIFGYLNKFFVRFFGYFRGGLNLIVRVRVGVVYSSIFVFEDLYEVVGIVRYRGVFVFYG